MTFKRLITGMGVALAVLAGPAVAQDAPGVTKDKIKIGILGSLTGPASIWGAGNLSGAIMAFEEVNAAGGIHGRKLEWVSEDDETSPPKALAGYKKLTGQDQVFAVFGPAASAIGAAMVPAIKAANVPTFIAVPSTPAVTEPTVKNLFRTGSLNDRMQGVAVADYVVGPLAGKRIALIRQSDEYGKRGSDSIVDRMKQKGSAPVSHEIFGPADTDFTSQILKIRETNPDVLIVYGYPSPSAIITRQAKQLGVSAKIIGSNATSSRKYPQIVGDAAAGTQNVITVAGLPESDEPAMKAYRERFEKRFPELVKQDRPDLADLLGYGGALAFVEGLKKAGPDLTRDKFVGALESLKDFKTGITLPTTFSAASHEGNNAARILEIQPDLSRKLLDVVITAE